MRRAHQRQPLRHISARSLARNRDYINRAGFSSRQTFSERSTSPVLIPTNLLALCTHRLGNRTHRSRPILMNYTADLDDRLDPD